MTTQFLDLLGSEILKKRRLLHRLNLCDLCQHCRRAHPCSLPDILFWNCKLLHWLLWKDLLLRSCLLHLLWNQLLLQWFLSKHERIHAEGPGAPLGSLTASVIAWSSDASLS